MDINVKPAECFKRWLEFKVITEGSNHQVFVDGKKLYDEKHNAFKKGKFVIAMWSSATEVFAIDDVNRGGRYTAGSDTGRQADYSLGPAKN